MMDKAPIRVLIVDDHTIVRKGLRALLDEQPDIQVVGEAGSGQEAIAQVAAQRPDLVLMDLVMAGMDGVETTRQVTAGFPHVRVLVLTSFASDDKVFPAIKAGALGYLLKETDAEALMRAIRQVAQGEPSLEPRIARRVLLELAHPSAPAVPNGSLTPEPLTAREVEVLKLIAQGLSNQEIADRLVIGEVTVRTHVSSILGKLHLANRVQAALYALREGISHLE